ncbi:MAG: putative toxin [Chloroflexi bacterium]|nr:putative toxin [Chloroflexota bacterium]
MTEPNVEAIVVVAGINEANEILIPTLDADAPAAIVEFLAGLGADGVEVRLGASAVLDWVDALLPDFVLLVDQLDGPRQAFVPFLDPGGLDRFLITAKVPRGGWSINRFSDFDHVVLGCWGPSAWAAAVRTLGAAADEDEVNGIARPLLALAALFSIPVHAASLAMDPEPAHRFLADVMAALTILQRSFKQPLPSQDKDIGRRSEVDQAIIRYIKMRSREIAELYNQIKPAPRSGPQREVPASCDEHVGALLELHAWHSELEEPLAKLSIAKHRFPSPAWRYGVRLPFGLTDPIDIDQNPRLNAIRKAHAAVPGWIREAIVAIGGNLSNLPGHNKRLLRITTVLQVVQALYAQIVMTESLLNDDSPEIGLWEDLEPLARGLDEWRVSLYTDTPLRGARAVESYIADMETLITSYRWAQILKRSIQNATEVMLLIRGAAGAGSSAASLLKGPPTGGAGAIAIGTAPLLRTADLARMVAGANVMHMARNKGKSRPTTLAGRLGQQGERRTPHPGGGGKGLDPNRPRLGFWSLLNPRKWRIPDYFPAIGDFIEVKNVLRLSLTRQLVDYMIYSQATQRRLILYIRPGLQGQSVQSVLKSRASGPLLDAINILKREGLLRVRFIPPRIP